MARNTENGSTPKVLTVKRAHTYINAAGLVDANGKPIEFSSQQVRNLFRQNDIVKAGVTEYTDPVTDETYKVVGRDALDAFITWRKENPEGTAKRGRAASNGERKAFIMVKPSDLEAVNALLSNAGYNAAEFPKRQVRKPRNTSDVVSSDQPVDGVEDLELIEVDA